MYKVLTDNQPMYLHNRINPHSNDCAHDQRSDGHWWYQSASHKWSTKHEFDTCRSASQGYWGLLS